MSKKWNVSDLHENWHLGVICDIDSRDDISFLIQGLPEPLHLVQSGQIIVTIRLFYKFRQMNEKFCKINDNWCQRVIYCVDSRDDFSFLIQGLPEP